MQLSVVCCTMVIIGLFVVFPLNHQQRQVPASGVTTGDCSFTANGKSSLRGDVPCGAAK